MLGGGIMERKLAIDRDWPVYNENLVVRNEFYLDVDWIRKTWKIELDIMNEGKVGHPYEFPESLIRLQAAWYQLVTYRGVEGITRKLSKTGLIPDYNDFSAIQRRVIKIKIEFGSVDRKKSIKASCDGTGMRFTNGGVHREQTYGRNRKRCIKVTIVSNVETKELLECDVSIEGNGLTEADVAHAIMMRFIREGRKIEKFWGDGSFHTKELFRFLEENGIESAVKLRENDVDSGKNTLRDREIQNLKKLGYKKWVKEKEYGLRWNATEGIFSSVKRQFGENVRSTKPQNAMKEVEMRFWLYDRMKKYAKERLHA